MELKKSKGIDPVLLHVRMPSYDALFFNILFSRLHLGSLHSSWLEQGNGMEEHVRSLCGSNWIITQLFLSCSLAGNQSVNTPNCRTSWEIWTNHLPRKKRKEYCWLVSILCSNKQMYCYLYHKIESANNSLSCWILSCWICVHFVCLLI